MSSAMDYLKHQTRKELQKTAKEWGIKANIRSEEIINKLLAEGFTPPSSAGTSSGDQPENCAPESPRADSVGSKPESASGKSRRRRAALHVKNDSEGVVQNEGHRIEPRPTPQQRSGPGQPKTQQVASMPNNTPTQPRASTMTQYYTPGALTPTELYDSPASSRPPGASPAVHLVPPAPPAHLKHTPHKLGKSASTPCKSRRHASGAHKVVGADQHASKRSHHAHSSRDQNKQTSPNTPLADITAGAQVSASPAQCIADMPSTAAALQRLKQTRSHGRVRSVPAPPPHLKHQSSSHSPPLDHYFPEAATSAIDKRPPHPAAPRAGSKAKQQSSAKAPPCPPVALSSVPQHLSKRSDKTRRTAAPQDPRTILSARSKRTSSSSGHRLSAADHAARTAAAAGHTMAVATAVAMHKAAQEFGVQTAALHQQIQQMNSTSRSATPMKSTGGQPTSARSRSAAQSESCSARTPQRSTHRAESAPSTAARSSRRPTTSSSAETVTVSEPSASPSQPVAPAHGPHGNSEPGHSTGRMQATPAVAANPSVVDLTTSPSPPQQCASPNPNASPTLPLQPAETSTHSGLAPVTSSAAPAPGTTAGRSQATQSLDRAVLAARPPTAPAAAKSRRVVSKDSAAPPALQSSSSGGTVSTAAEPQRTAAAPATARSRDRTPSKPAARRRKSPSQIVHAIHNAGQARTRPTQSTTDTSDPRLRAQVPPAAAARLPEEQKQVELDSALRRLQPPRFSSDDGMSASDEDDVDTRAALHFLPQLPTDGHSGPLPRTHTEPAHRRDGGGDRRRDVSVSDRRRQPDADGAVRGSRSAGDVAPRVERQSSLKELMQSCPVVRQRRVERQMETEEWMHERSRELDGLEESMQVLTLGGRSSSVMSADGQLPSGRRVLRTGSSSQMDSGALSKSVDQFLLAERAAAVAAASVSGRGRGAPERQRSRRGGGHRSVSPSPMKRGAVAPAAGPMSARPRLGTSGGDSAARPQPVNSSSSESSMAGVEAVSAAVASLRKAPDAGGLASGKGAAGLPGNNGSGPSPYMASPMAQKAPKTKSTVGALRTPSVQPRAAMMACQRKRA